MNKFKQITNLKFKLDEFHPILSAEVREWLCVNNINYECIFYRGMAAVYDGGNLYFEDEEDAVAFKLRWL